MTLVADVNISINGKSYSISCDDGQEQRVLDLANFIDSRLKEIAQASGANNDAHLLVLTSLVMADEMFDMRDNASNDGKSAPAGLQITKEQEGEIVEALDQMATRIGSLSGSLQKLA